MMFDELSKGKVITRATLTYKLIPIGFLIFLAVVLVFAMWSGIRNANTACANHEGYARIAREHVYCKDGTIIHRGELIE